MKYRATTLRDSCDDSMVHIGKDVEATMHLKIAKLELFKQLMSWLDKSIHNDGRWKDWIDDAQYDDNDDVESDKIIITVFSINQFSKTEHLICFN